MQIIIIEDEYSFNQIIYNNINKILIKKDLNYSLKTFKGYDDNLKKIIYNDDIKIYIIDLKLDGFSGYDICREIREQACDWNSMIIISSVHNEKENIISLRLGIFTYLSKLCDFESNLKETILFAIHIMKKNKFLKINRDCEISIKDICYILKEKNSKYCVIKTFYDEYRIRKSLKELEHKLHFKKHKNYLLINENNTKIIEKNRIVFHHKIEIKCE